MKYQLILSKICWNEFYNKVKTITDHILFESDFLDETQEAFNAYCIAYGLFKEDNIATHFYDTTKTKLVLELVIN